MQKIIPAFFWVLFFIFVLSNLPSLLETEIPPSDLGEVEIFSPMQKRLLDIHNNIRKSKRVEVLVLDNKLCEYAQRHAEHMAKKNKLTHSKMRSIQELSGAGVVGENIARGQEMENEVVSSWMRSPMHRWNILSSSYKKVGFGVEKGREGRNYWCVVFSD